MEIETAFRNWDGTRAYIQLFSRQPVVSGLVIVLTILGMLTDGLGLVALVPLLDALTGDGASSALSIKILTFTQSLGWNPTLHDIIVFFLALVALRGVIRVAKDWAATRLRTELTDQLRNEAMAALMDAEWRWLIDHKRSDQTNMLLTEVQRAGTGVFAALALLATSAAIIAYLIVAMSIEPLTTASAACVGGLMLLMFGGLRRRAMKLGQEQLGANRRLHGSALDSIGAIKISKILGTAAFHLGSFKQSVTELRRNQIRFTLLSGISRELFQFLGAVFVASYVLVGISVWDMPLPELLVMVFIFARLVPMLTSFQQYMHMMTNALPALQEAETMIAHARGAAEPVQKNNTAEIPLTRDLTLINMTIRFSESGPPALSDVSLCLPAGSTTVITGPSGAGKSTLADVFMGLLQPNQGHVFIDGNALAGANRIRWRQSVSYVPQEVTLYAGTVRDNLLRSRPDATQAEIDLALSAASAEFVYALQNGMDTVIGDGAQGLSGGEKQRLALARGLLRTPSLLVLDEVTSALDANNERAIRDSLAKLSGQMTIVILGHRNAFLEIADQVLRLEDGRVVDEVEVA